MKSAIVTLNGDDPSVLSLDWTEIGGARITMGIRGRTYRMFTTCSDRDLAEQKWHEAIANLRSGGYQVDEGEATDD
tara:strand:+ start:813 stop:1040 length:228 start_codon:yes stop_codon:yes gene_type:complete